MFSTLPKFPFFLILLFLFQSNEDLWNLFTLFQIPTLLPFEILPKPLPVYHIFSHLLYFTLQIDNYRSEHSSCLGDSQQPISLLCGLYIFINEYILTHENDNRCEKPTASPPVANVMDLITGRQLELFWGLLQKEDFSPVWETLVKKVVLP